MATRREELAEAATDYALEHGLIGLSLRPLAAGARHQRPDAALPLRRQGRPGRDDPAHLGGPLGRRVSARCPRRATCVRRCSTCGALRQHRPAGAVPAAVRRGSRARAVRPRAVRDRRCARPTPSGSRRCRGPPRASRAGPRPRRARPRTSWTRRSWASSSTSRSTRGRQLRRDGQGPRRRGGRAIGGSSGVSRAARSRSPARTSSPSASEDSPGSAPRWRSSGQARDIARAPAPDRRRPGRTAISRPRHCRSVPAQAWPAPRRPVVRRVAGGAPGARVARPDSRRTRGDGRGADQRAELHHRDRPGGRRRLVRGSSCGAAAFSATVTAGGGNSAPADQPCQHPAHVGVEHRLPPTEREGEHGRRGVVADARAARAGPRRRPAPRRRAARVITVAAACSRIARRG